MAFFPVNLIYVQVSPYFHGFENSAVRIPVYDTKNLSCLTWTKQIVHALKMLYLQIT